MSKTITRDEAVEIIKQLAYQSAQDFSGGTISLEENGLDGVSDFGSMYSDLLGKTLTVLEIALTGKQLEAAKSQIRDAFYSCAKQHRTYYEHHVKSIIDPLSEFVFAEHTHAGQIQTILNK